MCADEDAAAANDDDNDEGNWLITLTHLFSDLCDCCVKSKIQ